MIENPYLPANTPCDLLPVRKRTLIGDLLPPVITCLAFAFILYGLELVTNIRAPLAYSFPSFYPLRGMFYFDPLFGFCLQLMIYGIAIGTARHFDRFNSVLRSS